MPKHGWIKWFVAYMALAGGNFMVYSTVLPVRIFHHIIVSLIVLFWLFKYGLPKSHLLWPLLAVWVSVIISALAADDKRMALEFAWHWITNGIFLLMLTDWFRQHREQELLTAQFAAGGLIALSCVLEALLLGVRPGGLLLNINLAGGYMAALVVPAYVYASTRKAAVGKVLMWATVALIAIALFINQSRGALISVVVAVSVFSILHQADKLLKRLLVVAGLGALSGVALVLLSNLSGHAAGDIARMDLWRVAMDIINTRFLGVGPGLFGQAYQHLGIGSEYRYTGAHNLYLTLGSELGGVGLASGAGFVLTVLYGLVMVKRSPQQNASLAALCGIAAHMAVDNFPSQGFTFLASLYLAHVLYEWQPSFSVNRLKALPIGAVLVGCLFMLGSDRAQVAYEHSLATGSYSSAFEAVNLDPNNRLYQINLIRASHDGDITAAEAQYPEIKHSPSLMMYGLVNYGRVFQ